MKKTLYNQNKYATNNYFTIRLFHSTEQVGGGGWGGN